MRVIVQMGLQNRIKRFIDSKNVSAYEFARKVDVARNTIYNLCNNPDQIPAGTVIDKICRAYPGTQPNDLIYFEPDDEVA